MTRRTLDLLLGTCAGSLIRLTPDLDLDWPSARYVHADDRHSDPADHPDTALLRYLEQVDDDDLCRVVDRNHTVRVVGSEDWSAHVLYTPDEAARVLRTSLGLPTDEDEL